MAEQGTDRYGAEYKRTDNDFHVRYLEQDNCVCSICHGVGAKIEVRYVVRNYKSARAKNKICKNLQAHERSLWICPKCINNFKRKLSVINERNLEQLNKIDELPTIEERKNGKWIPDNTNPYKTQFVCSSCKESQEVPTIGFTKYIPIWDWCPLCGCKMEGEQL